MAAPPTDCEGMKRSFSHGTKPLQDGTDAQRGAGTPGLSVTRLRTCATGSANDRLWLQTYKSATHQQRHQGRDVPLLQAWCMDWKPPSSTLSEHTPFKRGVAGDLEVRQRGRRRLVQLSIRLGLALRGEVLQVLQEGWHGPPGVLTLGVRLSERRWRLARPGRRLILCICRTTAAVSTMKQALHLRHTNRT